MDPEDNVVPVLMQQQNAMMFFVRNLKISDINRWTPWKW